MATIKDIASKAGVSVMTVSRAFNNPEKVKEAVRLRILEIAEELDYVPNQAAKSLVGNKSGIVQIVTNMAPDTYYFTQLFTGAANYLSDHGLSIMINQHKKRHYQYDGAIYTGLAPGDDQALLAKEKKPFVLFGKSDLPIDWVDLDNVDGMYKVTSHLIEKGHRHIAFIGIEKNEPFTKERFVGFAKAMDEHDLKIDDKALFAVAHTVEAVREIGSKVVACEGITAVVCESDVLAYGLIDYCNANGIDVPDELSVVGFDGFMLDEIISPHITTVSQNIYEIGQALGKTLYDRMTNEEGDKQEVLIKTSFKEGASVKPLVQ